MNPRNFGNTVTRYRMPTALERQGDFSQSTDNLGNPFPYIKDPLLPGACSATNTSGCFADGGVLGRIPQSRLYQPGLAVLKWWPLPNMQNVPAGQAYNYEVTDPSIKLLGYQPIIRLDYQPFNNLRANFKYLEYQQPNDVDRRHPGGIQRHEGRRLRDLRARGIDQLDGQLHDVRRGGGGREFPSSGGLFDHRRLAELLPQRPAGQCQRQSQQRRLRGDSVPLPRRHRPRARHVLVRRRLAQRHDDLGRHAGCSARRPFTWGNRIANAPPNFQGPFSNFILDTRVYNFNTSLTKVTGSHTFKTGYYYFYSYQRRGQGAILGSINFQNDTNNPLDSGFGFANAALGIFSSYSQLSRWGEGAYTAMNHEAYIQDNWKVKDNLTLDYGVRFVHQVPQYDGYGKSSNFLPEEWSPSQAPVLYIAGCANGVNPCTGTNRQAMNPLTRQFLGPNSAAAIGTLVPGTGTPDQRHFPVGPGHRRDQLHLSGARRGASRRGGVGCEPQPEVRGPRQRRPVLRSPAGPERLQHGEQPAVLAQRHRAVRTAAGSEQRRPHHRGPAVADRLAVRRAAAELVPVEHGRAIGDSVQLVPRRRLRRPAQLGIPATGATSTPSTSARRSCPRRRIRRRPAPCPARDRSPRSIRTWRGTIAATAASACSRPCSGAPIIRCRSAINRRLINGLALGFADTISLYDRQLAPLRLQHNADGTVTNRADQEQANELLGNNNPQTHIMRANFVWQVPRIRAPDRASRRRSMHILRDWSVSGIWSAATGAAYAVTPSYTSNGANVNLTGSPDYAARVNVTGDPAAAAARIRCANSTPRHFRGPCPAVSDSSRVTAICEAASSASSIWRSRATITLGVGNSSVQLRLDVFNLFNQATVTNRNTTMQMASPSAPNAITNLPFDANGNVIDSRSRPRGAGFGVATDYQSPRTLQMQIRLSF